MQKLKLLVLKYPNWRNYTIKRHHKFIDKLIENEYDTAKVANIFGYSKEDIEQIFSKILPYLEKMEKEIEEKRYFIQLEKNIVLPDDKKKKMIHVLKECKKIKKLDTVFPPRLAQMIQSLHITADLDYTAKLLGVEKMHVVERIIGRKKPRKPCEKGAIYYLKQTSNTAS
jgi:hypothetical protein